MLKQKTLLIIIITVLCGLLAGVIAFYQQQKTSQTVSVDIISTIVPIEQEKPSSLPLMFQLNPEARWRVENFGAYIVAGGSYSLDIVEFVAHFSV